MKRVVFQNSRNLKLVGTLYPASSTATIIMAHGFGGDRSMSGRFDKIADSFNRAGYRVLTFDFSGCGESDDDALTAEKEVDDLRAAVAFAKSSGAERLAFYGHSLGTLICLRAFTPEIQTMALSGACTGPMRYDWDQYYSAEQLQELAATGKMTVVKESRPSGRQVLDRQMFLDFAQIESEPLLSHVTCPVLIIHGNSEQDWEERALLENTRRGMPYLSSDSRLEVIDGADHRFYEHLDVLIELAKEWYLKYLPR